METNVQNPAVENNFSNNNTKGMIYKMDLTSVCGEEVVAQTAKVDQQVVNDLFNAFMAIPSSVVVKFRHDNGYLKMIVKRLSKK